jgi:hypothetical protein
MTRETIYAALFTAITDAVHFKTQSRKLKHWNDVGDESQQPALFMAQTGEVAERRKGLPTKWTLNVKLYLYCLAPDDETAVTTIMNPLLDTICGLIDPGEKGSTNTLSIAGVSHVWIEGNIETDEGALGRQGVAIIPISILVA